MRLLMIMGLGMGLLFTQASCVGGTEEVASAAELLRDSCALGLMETVQRCGGVDASCHVCGRPTEATEAVCLQPCTLGANDCPGAQRCVPIGGLRDGGGYARIGDCPAGYCQ